MRPGQLRQHARLLRARYNEQDTRDAEAARSQAALMEAEAELVETQADIISPAPEEDCTIRINNPILGEIICKGGKIEGIEYPWEQDHVDALYKIGIDMAFEWCHDPRAGLRQGQLIRIYIGTKDIGPRVMWCDGIWSSHKSHGNYGKNWACGGNWSSVGAKKSKHLNNIAPDLAQKIKEAKMDIERIKKVEAKVKAAQKRILACSQRDMAASYNRQASHPAYPGQEIICAGKASMVSTLASKTEAEAELIEARAGL
jgi:hypothetical protein